MTPGNNDSLPRDAERIASTYREAMLAHQAGQLDSASLGYQAVLSIAADHPGATYLLGVVHLQKGDDEAAEHYFRQAIGLQDEASFFASLAELLHRTGRLAEAETFYRKSIALQPEEAVAHCNLGSLLRQRGCLSEAERCYRRAIQLQPDMAESHYNLGNLLEETQRFAAAEQAYRTAIRLSPDFLAALNNLGKLLTQSNRLDEAEAVLRRALALTPQDSGLHYNLANLLLEKDAVGAAESAYREALARDPQNADAHFNLGKLLQQQGRIDEAESSYRQAIDCQADNVDAVWNLALLLLREGRYDEGWHLYDIRLDGGAGKCIVEWPARSFPRWQGEDLAGKAILVCCEQGMGDAIQFVRYLPLLKARGASRVSLLCPLPLAELFATLAGVDAILTDAAAATDFDCCVALLSLPRYCATTLATIPARLPYLAADPLRLEHWRERLPEAAFRVGLVWRGNPAHENDRHRSLPGLATLAPLFGIPGAAFISLQSDAAEKDSGASAGFPQVLCLGDELRDFADTAAVVAQLDLLISVDTATAHLAGALGIPCWLLLPAAADWRWLRERDDSPWYPGVLRLFRQTAASGWEATVAELALALPSAIERRRLPAADASVLPPWQQADGRETAHVFFVHSPITYSIALATIEHLGLTSPLVIGARGLRGGRIECSVEDDGIWSIGRTCAVLACIAQRLSPTASVALYLPHSGFLLGKLMALSGRVAALHYLEEGYTSAQAPLLKQPVAAFRIDTSALIAALAENELLAAWGLDERMLSGINASPDYFFNTKSPKYRGAFACSPDAFTSMAGVTRLPLAVAAERQNAALLSIEGIRNRYGEAEQIERVCQDALDIAECLSGERDWKLPLLIKLHPVDQSGLPSWFYRRLGAFGLDYVDYCRQHGIDPNGEPALANFEHYFILGRTAQAKYVAMFLGKTRLSEI